MLEAIVLLWMAIKLQAPTWVYFIISFMLVIGVLNFVIDVIDKVQKKQIEKGVAELTDEQYGELADRYLERFEEWRRENNR